VALSVSPLHDSFAEACTLNANPSQWGVLLLALMVTIDPVTTAGVAAQGKSINALKKSPRRAAHADYQVPAGTLLAIELRTPLGSETSQRSDAIRGVLKSALNIDGVELVPAGAVAFGTVTDVAPALRKTDRARLAFRFNVLEHPATGSRAAIRTETRTLEVEAGKRIPGAEGAAAFNQIRLERGADVSVSLLEPFLVRIPDEDKAGK
jgi:hypothetical protein